MSTHFHDVFGEAGKGPGVTFSLTNPYAALLREPNRRIDYIFVRGGDERFRGEPLDARVAFDQPMGEAFPSDHFGLVAEIRA
jgi:endonuclease/exonuclease/phosphatase family metal-dependent hydrolase